MGGVWAASAAESLPSGHRQPGVANPMGSRTPWAGGRSGRSGGGRGGGDGEGGGRGGGPRPPWGGEGGRGAGLHAKGETFSH